VNSKFNRVGIKAELNDRLRKPQVILFSQILIYLAGAVNLGNGLFAISAGDSAFCRV
jgi:hypothetical protein